MTKENRLERIELSPSILTLILLAAGPTISWLALPIEGEFWTGLMPVNGWNQHRAYGLSWAIDFFGGLLIYMFGRIQQTERKGSKRWRLSFWILAFAGVCVVSSWWVGFQQLRTIRPDVYWWASMLNAGIVPMVQLGIGFAQAVLEGKFDSPTVEPKKQRLKRGQPTLDWWRVRYEQLDGARAQMTPERVRELISSEWEAAPSPTTLYNWARECVQSMNGKGENNA